MAYKKEQIYKEYNGYIEQVELKQKTEPKTERFKSDKLISRLLIHIGHLLNGDEVQGLPGYYVIPRHLEARDKDVHLYSEVMAYIGYPEDE